MREFKLTAEHVKLLRAAQTWWDHGEYGAPGIDPKRPFGSTAVAASIHRILGWPAPEEERARERYFEQEGLMKARKIHVELETALEVVLRTGSFEPGTYTAQDYTRDWRRV